MEHNPVQSFNLPKFVTDITASFYESLTPGTPVTDEFKVEARKRIANFATIMNETIENNVKCNTKA